MTIEHVRPRSRGGSNKTRNLMQPKTGERPSPEMKQQQCHLTFVHRPDAAIENLVLAVTLAGRHYDVHVHTTPELSLRLSDVGLKATYWTRTWADHKPWSRHKLDTYQAVCSGYSGPFLHIDDDFFLYEPVPRSDLFCQGPESPEHYEWARRLPPDWGFYSTRAFNMGVFGGRGDWIEAYTLEAFKALKAAPHALPPNVEQLVLGHCVEKFGWPMTSFSGLDHHNPPGWYGHLMASKKDPAVQAEVRRMLREHAPWFPVQEPLTKAKKIFIHAGAVTANTVRDYYRQQVPAVREVWSPLDPKHVCLTNTVPGLGDTVMLTDLEFAAQSVGRSAYTTSQSPHWGPLMEHCPTHRDKWLPLRVCLPGAHRKWGLGPGHLIQRARRLFGLPQIAVPKGHLAAPVTRVPGRVCIHTSAGPQAEWQRRHVHPRARVLYPDTVAALLRLANRKDLTFVEVGTKRTLHHPRVEDGTGPDLRKLIRLTAECEFFVGINSGPMHVAAALGLKIVALINFPRPILLPNLMDTGTVEEEWLYPQAVHLHQDVGAAWMPRFSLKHLEAALNGDVYPYWRTDVAEELIREI